MVIWQPLLFANHNYLNIHFRIVDILSAGNRPAHDTFRSVTF